MQSKLRFLFFYYFLIKTERLPTDSRHTPFL
uniref:Uncharacterized protein n=1 Tax=Anguilla anguilla TaxID=7936 RepID=A0A0E9UWG8_ANGAN